MSQKKQGVGRPRTRPRDLIRLRCEVSPGEADEVRRAVEASGLSQWEFCRRAVVDAARRQNRKTPAG